MVGIRIDVQLARVRVQNQAAKANSVGSGVKQGKGYDRCLPGQG